MKIFRSGARSLIAVYLLLVATETTAAESFKLRDYAAAVRANDAQRMQVIRSYILGAVETHLLYSKMLSDWTGANILCTGRSELDIDQLGAMFEVKIMALRKRYGEDIMGMPVLRAVQMMVEEQYRCF